MATDLAEPYRSGLTGRLDHAVRVADPFHVVRVANRCLEKVRRRVQNETQGHRGRKHDPLYRIRIVMLKGVERLDGMGVDRMLLGPRAGDPDEGVLGAWLAKESVRDVYLPGWAWRSLEGSVGGSSSPLAVRGSEHRSSFLLKRLRRADVLLWAAVAGAST